MELTRRGVGNPEQRIEQDCNSFTSQTLGISLGLLLQVMTLVTFTAVLWNLSSGFLLPLFGGINVPGYMMWAAVAYALVGSWATYLIGRPLVRINFALERYNADFRYRMVRIPRTPRASRSITASRSKRGGSPARSPASSRPGGLTCATISGSRGSPRSTVRPR
jgi:putative ATP-binding cassette transporter